MHASITHSLVCISALLTGGVDSSDSSVTYYYPPDNGLGVTHGRVRLAYHHDAEATGVISQLLTYTHTTHIC